MIGCVYLTEPHGDRLLADGTMQVRPVPSVLRTNSVCQELEPQLPSILDLLCSSPSSTPRHIKHVAAADDGLRSIYMHIVLVAYRSISQQPMV